MGIHFAWLLLLSPLSASAAPRAFTLTELFRATVDRSDRVQSKIEERTQAEETKSKSKAGFLPQISGIGTYQRNDSPPRSSATASIFPEQQKNARIVAKQYLFQGGSEYAYLSRTNSLLESKEAELEESRRTYYLDLAVAYYDLLLKRANLQHAKTELDLYDDQIKELNSRVKIGRSRRTDLLTARAGRASSESRLRAAETEVEAARLVLENLTKTENFQIREENPVDRPLDDLSAYLKASEQRPDLVAARKRRDAVSADIAYYRGFHFPSLDVGGNYYLHREGGNANSKWDATLTLTLPIFSGGATQADVRNAASLLRQTEVETGNLERNAETEIRNLHQTLLLSQSEMKSLAEAVDLAKKAYEQTRKDYRFGLTSNLDLLDTLRFLTEAKKNFDQSKYQHIVERIRLEIGAGRIPTS